MKKKNIIYLLLVGTLFSSCSKEFLNVDPQSTINPDQLGSSPAATLGTLKGVFATLRSALTTGYAGHEDYGHKGVLSVIDLMGNDVIMDNLNWGGFNYNYTGRVSTNSRSHFPWFTYYTQIKNVNTIVNNVAPDTEDADLKAIRGQALALRGYFHFMLARIYGPTYLGNASNLSVPINAAELSSKRNTVEEVYSQIETDLKDAIVALDGYSRPSKEMVDKSVAQAFLADVYLEMGKYADAAELANQARQSYSLLTEDGWKNGFYDINQAETMWGADLNAELTTFVASFFSHFDNTNEGYSEGGNISIDRRLYDAMPSTDLRKSMFLGSEGGEYDGVDYSPYISLKFRDLTSDRTQGDYIYLRSALMYYIEAEGLAKSNNEAGARDALFEITSKRDPQYVKSTKSGQALIDEIILQKRIELWGEGFAYFDIKRLGEGVVRDYSGSNHPTYGKFNIPTGDSRLLFMIPQAEVDANPDILPNNPQ
ncbi:RagB/SusD family nutrient uptake outer membrane protein [Sphingobacterium alkalisoli]|uniref:RagB/SusD family nutrient uptake outer membrane protein n=1 Tax=Sphingobacterium alkalisoli TaxID=1874115 RepID=A0A4U0GZG1_9SPHI|nr:RagB/SusD family nutrient uptake outer membrane protein [Sphingobacterium alkalisoli]TJY64486.1 RagB/SusD family nutrient uptake outer membrane protein [Sphingobacterium alkalisoli]GGH21458.1 membrane protein [Sphingobacterium alkalisoli]